jgi:hypothetical protein
MNLVSVGVNIEISVLIHFPSKATPERQQIFVSFDSKHTEQTAFEFLFNRNVEIGEISIEIRHTERTWADDLYNLMHKEIQTISSAEGRGKKLLRKAFLPFITLLFPLSTTGAMLFTVRDSLKNRRDSVDLLAKKLLESSDLGLDSLHDKVNALLQSQLLNESFKTGYKMEIVFISAFVATGLVFMLAINLSRPTPSFVTVSDAALKHKQRILVKLKRKNFILAGSMILSVVLGVLGNYIYDQIK